MVSTTFYQDFTIAERFGIGAVRDTWRRVFREWGNDIDYLAALCIAVNTKCWDWYHAGDYDLSNEYAEMYYKCKDRAYSERFTSEEHRRFFEVTD